MTKVLIVLRYNGVETDVFGEAYDSTEAAEAAIAEDLAEWGAGAGLVRSDYEIKELQAASRTTDDGWYDLAVERAGRTISDRLRRAYGAGETASLMHGAELDRLCEGCVRQVGQAVSSFEQGAGAELRRLKDWLADSLPADWEERRFARIVGVALMTRPTAYMTHRQWRNSVVLVWLSRFLAESERDGAAVPDLAVAARAVMSVHGLTDHRAQDAALDLMMQTGRDELVQEKAGRQT